MIVRITGSVLIRGNHGITITRMQRNSQGSANSAKNASDIIDVAGENDHTDEHWHGMTDIGLRRNRSGNSSLEPYCRIIG